MRLLVILFLIGILPVAAQSVSDGLFLPVSMEKALIVPGDGRHVPFAATMPGTAIEFRGEVFAWRNKQTGAIRLGFEATSEAYPGNAPMSLRGVYGYDAAHQPGVPAQKAKDGGIGGLFGGTHFTLGAGQTVYLRLASVAGLPSVNALLSPTVRTAEPPSSTPPAPVPAP